MFTSHHLIWWQEAVNIMNYNLSRHRVWEVKQFTLPCGWWALGPICFGGLHRLESCWSPPDRVSLSDKNQQHKFLLFGLRRFPTLANDISVAIWGLTAFAGAVTPEWRFWRGQVSYCGLLDNDTVLSGTWMIIFRGKYCLHLQGRRRGEYLYPSSRK
jgi:hypothetical protein